MVIQCEVCKKLDYLNPDLSFHRFTANVERRKIWYSLLGFEEEKVLPKGARICSSHFSDSDFEYKPNGAKYLKRDAKPTLVRSRTSTPSTSSVAESADDESTPSMLQDSPVRKLLDVPDVSLEEIVPLSMGIPKMPFSGVEKDSSTTLTASETEEVIIRKVLDQQHVSDMAGPSSEFRGQLALLKSPKKRKRTYAGDWTSEDFSSPKRKSVFKKMKVTIGKQRSKIRNLSSQVRRLKKKITNMESLIVLLKKKSLISESSENTVKASVHGAGHDIFQRMLKGPSTQKYDPSLRSFALTLSFYSPRAYNFVRNTFNRSLPHLGTISKWFRSVDGSPGFTQEALSALKLKTKCLVDRGEEVLCNLVLDEMSIRRQIEWTGKKFTGYVDVGTDLDSDTLAEAREALVFMLVSLHDSWKIPVGYFLIDGLEAEEKAGLVKKCIEFVAESGVTVTSLTFDGAPVNFKMAKELGCDFSNEFELKTYFKNPVTNDNVFVYLDPSHMIKLVRNCLGSQKVINNGEGGVIEWRFIEQLFEYQNQEGLHAATKLKLRHLEWAREKMKVCVATQTLSKSVSDALLFLSHDMKIPSFKNVDATADFILKLNNLFDIFNSRNRFAKYYFKKPLSPNTQKSFFEYLDVCSDFLLNLNQGGIPILDSKRKTGFLGFLISISSLKEMYTTYVVKKNTLPYLNVYKISQDHLETFFGAIRSKGGFNNNPTARQFEAAYKRLIVHAEISGPITGNVIDLDNIKILSCGSGNITHTEDLHDLEESSDYISFLESVNKDFEESFLNSTAWDLTDYVEDIIAYISGFVVKCLKKCVVCIKCRSILESEMSHSSLQNRKKFGNLINASKFVIDICKAGERYFRFFQKTKNIFNKNIKSLVDILITNTMRNLGSNIYNHFGDHLYETSIIDSHPIQLIKLCLKNYFKVRIHYETKKLLDSTRKRKIRSINTKVILFQNQ